LKDIWKHKLTLIAKAIPTKMSNTEDITIPDFKLYGRALAIKKHGIGTKQIGRLVDKNRRHRHKPMHL
jgi:hypothetical protein